MIDLRKLAQFQYQEKVKIVCTNGMVITGNAGEVDDEEESGIDEPGVTFYSDDGRLLEIGLSEIDSISIEE